MLLTSCIPDIFMTPIYKCMSSFQGEFGGSPPHHPKKHIGFFENRKKDVLTGGMYTYNISYKHIYMYNKHLRRYLLASPPRYSSTHVVPSCAHCIALFTGTPSVSLRTATQSFVPLLSSYRQSNWNHASSHSQSTHHDLPRTCISGCFRRLRVHVCKTSM